MFKKPILLLSVLLALPACKKTEPQHSSVAASSPAVVEGVKVSAAVRTHPMPVDPSATPTRPVALPDPLPAKVKYLSQTIKGENANGVINPGEKIIVTPCIQNIGKGPGRELSVNISADTMVPAIDEFSIWPVKPGETKCFPIEFWVPSKAGGEYPVKFAFSDGTKKEIYLTVSARSKTIKENTVYTEKERIKEKMQKAIDDLN